MIDFLRSTGRMGSFISHWSSKSPRLLVMVSDVVAVVLTNIMFEMPVLTGFG